MKLRRPSRWLTSTAGQQTQPRDSGVHKGYSWRVVPMHGVAVSKDGYHICWCRNIGEAEKAIDQLADPQ